jgi:hypothetical protein
MTKKIWLVGAFMILATPVFGGGVPNPANIDTLPGSGLTNNDFVLGSSIQGLKDASFATVPVSKGGTGLTSGTSGGILGFTGSTTLTSSAALTIHAITIGGGAGATPYPLASLGSTHTLLHGGTGDPTWGAVDLATETTGTLPAGSCPIPTGVTLGCVYAPANPPAAHNWLTGYNGTTWLTAQPDYTDITGLGTAATQNTGTSGATIPMLNGANQWGADQIFAPGSCSLPGVALGSPGDSGFFNYGVSDDIGFCAAAHLRAVFYGSTSNAPVVFGNTTANVVPTSILGGNNGIENIGTVTQYGAYRALSLKNTAGGSPLIALSHSRSATNGSFSALTSGDFLGFVSFGGDDGASYDTTGATIVAISKGTWTGGVGPSDLILGVQNNAGALVKVACLDADTGWWNGSGGVSTICSGSNFLDRSNNATFLSAVFGSPTGGNKGSGTINATTIYQNGTVLATIATSGSASDLTTGTVAAARMPAYTGDVTSPVGTTVNTVAKIQGTTVSGTTGSGNVVFSASPTFTGTITGASVAFSGAGGTCTNQFVRIISTALIPTCNTVNLASDVTGTLPSGSFGPLTGDVTTSGYAATVAKIQGTVVSGTTGSTNVAFSASPTFTGTVQMAASHSSGSSFIDADFYWTNDITPPLITANQDDYAPTGNATAVVFRLSGDVTPRTITGLAGGADGRLVMFINVGANNLIIATDNIGSSAANRFRLGTSTDITLTPDDTMVFEYDATVSRWRWVSSQLPTPGPAQLGGINSAPCTGSNWVKGYNSTGSATCTQPTYGDISGLGTAATQNTGTSGATLPFLNGVNTWSAAQTFSNGATINSGLTLGTPLTGANGGTNNGFMQFSGPASTLKTYTLPNSTTTLLSLLDINVNVAPATSGSTVLLGNGTGGFANYTGVTCTGQFIRALNSSGDGLCAAVSLVGDVSGILPIANGGTNASTTYGALTSLGVPLHDILENPSFDVWQENTTYSPNTGANTFIADRWKVRTFTTAANGSRTFSQVAGYSGAQFALKIQRAAANAETAQATVGQQIYTKDSIPLQSTTLHLACDVKWGANYSPNGLNGVLFSGTGIDETVNLNGGFATGAASANFSTVPTSSVGNTTHADFGTVAVPSTETELAVRISTNTWIGTAGADDSVSITNCNLTVATGDVPYSKPQYEVELRNAQFTYRKSFTYATVPVQNAGALTGESLWSAGVAGAAAEKYYVFFGNTMRAAPTITFYNPAAANANCRDETAAADGAAGASSNVSEKGFFITCNGNAATAVNNTMGIHWVADIRL